MPASAPLKNQEKKQAHPASKGVGSQRRAGGRQQTGAEGREGGRKMWMVAQTLFSGVAVFVVSGTGVMLVSGGTDFFLSPVVWVAWPVCCLPLWMGIWGSGRKARQRGC